MTPTTYFAAALAACLLASQQQAVVADDPVDFFGGEDHAAYLEWVDGVVYDSAEFVTTEFDASQGAAIHWSVNDGYLELGVAVKATGWLGFGISENGGMRGADMMLFEAQNPDVIIDAFVLEVYFPQEDVCQDWELVSSSTDSDFIMVQARRKLDTGDSQDLAIINDGTLDVPTQRIIAAWGDSDTVSYHGNKRARGAIRWFGIGDEESNFHKLMDESADGSFFIGADEHAVLPVDTEYIDYCQNADQLRLQNAPIDAGATIIGFEAIVTSEHVHHFIVSAYNTETNDTECNMGFGEMVYLWAPGDKPLALPERIGGPLGGDDGFRHFNVEIHYDNPDFKSTSVDSSGVKVYYSLTPREVTFGIVQIGDPAVMLDGQTVGDGLVEHAFDCPSDCSTLVLDGPVTVIREYHHMHQSGASAQNIQIRDGEVVRSAQTDFFDFRQQGGQVVIQEPYEIQPGDSFQTRCFYRSNGDEKTFGLASKEEMCIVFLMYYPRKKMATPFGEFPWLCGYGLGDFGLTACDAAWTERTLADDTSLERVFGTPSDQCSAPDGSETTPDGSETKSKSTSAAALMPSGIRLLTVAMTALFGACSLMI